MPTNKELILERLDRIINLLENTTPPIHFSYPAYDTQTSWSMDLCTCDKKGKTTAVEACPVHDVLTATSRPSYPTGPEPR